MAKDVDWSGAERFLKHINFQAKAGVREGAEELRDNLQNILNNRTRSGTHYRRYPNRSSAPGEPPKSQTHQLEQSIHVIFSGGSSSLEAVVDVSDPKGKKLEFGDDKIAPRPWFHPTVAKSRRRVRETISRRIRAAF